MASISVDFRSISENFLKFWQCLQNLMENANLQMELDDVAPLKKLRVGTNGKGTRADWFLDKVHIFPSMLRISFHKS